MKPEQENFEPLRRLLKLKRHEQPPPRYFNDFSSQVIARLRAGEAGPRETSLDSDNWLVRLWSFIEAKPMIPGAIGVAICALLVFGAVYTETTASAPMPESIGLEPLQPGPDSIFALGVNPSEPRPVPAAFTNMNPVMGTSLFDQIPLPPPELVNRPFGNR